MKVLGKVIVDWGFLAAINVANGRNGAVKDDGKFCKGEIVGRKSKHHMEIFSIVKKNENGGGFEGNCWGFGEKGVYLRHNIKNAI